MGLITLNLKRVLNWNFIFMSAVAAIFGMISLMNFGDISENIVFGVDIKYFMLDGYLCLFIFFAGEISKDMLQQEKITKRIEWKLANGIKISSIVKENLLSLWIGTLILLFPLLLIISIRLPNLISKGHKSTTPPLLDPLTDREAEIIKAIGTGKTKHEIAQELYISERTLYNHIQSIYDKLGAKNAIEAYNKAIALGYITPLI